MIQMYKIQKRQDKWKRQLEEINKAYALQVNALARDYFTTRLSVGAALVN